MISIDKLCPVGIGTYRMEAAFDQHTKALQQAIESGCNFIDTASYYMFGRSEQMIGEFLKNNPDLQRKVFLMTKAGYVGDLRTEEELATIKSEVGDEMIMLPEDHKHCIHPDFLRRELNTSLQRLGKQQIDCFLIHNPEYYFRDTSSSPTQKEYYRRLKNALECCEAMVQEGLIRYYGISSNTFPSNQSDHDLTNINEVLKIVQGISENNHFKFVQFPVNLVEQGAFLPQYDGKSLVDILHENNIRAIANRPLNAEDEDGFIRLAEYTEETFTPEELTADKEQVAHFISLLDQQVKTQSADHSALDFPIVEVLQENYDKIGNITGVVMFYQNLKHNFLIPLFEEEVPENITELFEQLKEKSKKYSRQVMTARAQKIKQQLINNQEIEASDQRPLPVIAVDRLLEKGIDHVLVGMRKTKYVDQFNVFFNPHVPDML